MSSNQSSESKIVIDVNGIEVELDKHDLAKKKRYKIGDQIKVLKKQYGDTYKAFPGIIAGFDNFEARPTITVAYIENSYDKMPIKFDYLNKDSKDIEICHNNGEDTHLEKQTVLDLIENEIVKKQQEIFDLEKKREFFLKNFLKYFSVDKQQK